MLVHAQVVIGKIDSDRMGKIMVKISTGNGVQHLGIPRHTITLVALKNGTAKSRNLLLQ